MDKVGRFTAAPEPFPRHLTPVYFEFIGSRAIGVEVTPPCGFQAERGEHGIVFHFKTGSYEKAGAGELFLGYVSSPLATRGLEIDCDKTQSFSSDAVANEDDETEKDARADRKEGGGDEEPVSLAWFRKNPKIDRTYGDSECDEDEEDDPRIERTGAEIIKNTPSGAIIGIEMMRLWYIFPEGPNYFLNIQGFILV